MSLATSSIAQRYAANNTSASVNTNTSTKMTNIKSIEIVQNIALTDGTIPATAFAKVQSKKGVIMTTRSAGAIRYNTTDDTVYTTFMPLCEKAVDAYGNYNRAIVIFHMEDGTSKTLNTEETVKFWNEVLGDEDATRLNFSIKANFNSADYHRSVVDAGIRNNRFRSVRIVLNNLENLFRFHMDHEYHWLTLLPVQADVNFHSKTVDCNAEALGFSMPEDFFVTKAKANNVRFADVCAKDSKSSKRRESRRAKAQTSAARISVADKVQQRATVATTAPKAETPVVDTEKEALRKENAELKAEVKGLKAELANTNAKLDQILAMMAAQAQPVAESTPVVEEVTPEPVVEEEPEVVEEELTVEETPVEEPPARGFQTTEDAFNAAFGGEGNPFFNLMDDEDE